MSLFQLFRLDRARNISGFGRDFSDSDFSDDPRVTLSRLKKIHKKQEICFALLLFCWAGAALAVFSPSIAVGAWADAFSSHPRAFLLGAAAAGVISLALCGNVVRTAFSLRGGFEAAAVLAVTCALGQTGLFLWQPDSFAGGSGSCYLPHALLTLVFLSGNQLLSSGQMLRNFRFISSRHPKKGAVLWKDGNKARQLALLSGLHDIYVTSGAETSYLSGFMELSQSRSLPERALAPFALPALLCCAALGGWGAFTGGPAAGLSAVVLALCLAVPSWAGLSAGIPLSRAARQLKKDDVFLSGSEAAENLSLTNLVAAEELDLFEPGSIELLSMRPFARAHLNFTIMAAASILREARCALFHVFFKLMDSNADFLQPVEDLSFEHNSGFSAAVRGRRILIGSGGFLSRYGISPPSHDFEGRLLKDGGTIVYVSVDDDISAAFVVRYGLAKPLSGAFESLERQGVCLAVLAGDPNITPALAAQAAGMEEQNVRVLTRTGDLFSLPASLPRIPATLAWRGGFSGFIKGLCACFTLMRVMELATVIVSASALLSFGLLVYLTATDSLPFIGSFGFLVEMIVWAAAALAPGMVVRLSAGPRQRRR